MAEISCAEKVMKKRIAELEAEQALNNVQNGNSCESGAE